MFDDKIDEITEKIRVLEDELITEFNKQEEEILLKLQDEKKNFEESIIKEGRTKIIRSLEYLSSQPIPVTLTIPFIWSMIIPIVVIDLMVTIYQ